MFYKFLNKSVQSSRIWAITFSLIATFLLGALKKKHSPTLTANNNMWNCWIFLDTRLKSPTIHRIWEQTTSNPSSPLWFWKWMRGPTASWIPLWTTSIIPVRVLQMKWAKVSNQPPSLELNVSGSNVFGKFFLFVHWVRANWGIVWN